MNENLAQLVRLLARAAVRELREEREPKPKTKQEAAEEPDETEAHATDSG